MFDAHGPNTVNALFHPAARTATANGTGVDMKDYVGRGKAVLQVGTVSGTSPTLDVKLQDSADNSTFADISGATFTQVTAADQLQSIGVDLDAAKRYIRAVVTIAGTTPSFTCGVTIQGQKQLAS